MMILQNLCTGRHFDIEHKLLELCGEGERCEAVKPEILLNPRKLDWLTTLLLKMRKDFYTCRFHLLENHVAKIFRVSESNKVAVEVEASTNSFSSTSVDNSFVSLSKSFDASTIRLLNSGKNISRACCVFAIIMNCNQSTQVCTIAHFTERQFQISSVLDSCKLDLQHKSARTPVSCAPTALACTWVR